MNIKKDRNTTFNASKLVVTTASQDKALFSAPGATFPPATAAESSVFPIATEERFRFMVENLEDYAIFLLSPEGFISSWNIGAERIKGYVAQEIIGQHFSVFYGEDDREAGKPQIHLERAMAQGRAEDEGWRIRKDGTRFYANVVITAMRNGQGELQGYAKVTRDITEKRNAEVAMAAKNDEISAMTQQLWQVARLATMGELAASVAHELNNPLATITLRIGLLLDVITDEAQCRSLATIGHEAARMGHLVSNLLQFSHRSQQQTSTVDLPTEIEKTLDLIHYHLRNRDIGVIMDFPSRLPPIQADRQQLRQLFLNLITNASDAMRKGGTLTLRVRVKENCVIAQVEDTGCGIAPDDMERVSEPFFTTKPEGQGTGLGLSICRRIMQEHNGTLEIQSEIGRGTQVQLCFPTMTEQL